MITITTHYNYTLSLMEFFVCYQLVIAATVASGFPVITIATPKRGLIFSCDLSNVHAYFYIS